MKQEKKKIGVINIIMLVFSAFIFLCYFPYLVMIISRGESLSSCLIALTVVILATVPCAYCIINRNKLNRFLKVLRAIYIAGMCFYVVTFSVFTTYIAINAHTAEKAYEFAGEDGGDGDVILVFGCRTYGYTPGQQLRARLDTAAKLLAAMPEAVCIVSGGEGPNEGVAEAYSMKNYLENKGISPERIYAEAESHNTYENIEYSLALIEREGIEYDRVIGVSTDFHIPRVEYLLAHYGVDHITVAAESLDAWQFFMSVIREYMAYVKLFIVT